MTTRVFVARPLVSGERVELPEDAAHHLVQVLRRKPGDPLVLFNGEGGEFEAQLDAAGKRGATAVVGKWREVSHESPLRITLAQCVSKGDRMDYTLQKATELGVWRVVPLTSERSVVRLDAERQARKLEHWRGVVVSACEQSGRTRVPEVQALESLDAWLDHDSAAPGPKLVLAPGARGSLRQRAAPAERHLTLLVGPEGGLSIGEIGAAEDAGFEPLSMGPRVLRTETAGVAAIAALQALWGDLI